MAEILIVEDSRNTANAVAFELWNAGHGVLFAEDGEKAMARLAIGVPDLILLDYSLPGIGGLELLRILRREYTNLPVIVITGVGNEEIAAEVMREGASDYLPKHKGFLAKLPMLVQRALAAEYTRRELRKKEEALREAHASLELRVAERTAELREANLRLQREALERGRVEVALRQSESEHRYLIQNAASIILKLDTEGRILFANDFATRHFGYSRAEMIGRPLMGLIVPEIESTGRDLAGLIEDLLRRPDRYATNEIGRAHV